jgi:hypothetical protein
MVASMSSGADEMSWSQIGMVHELEVPLLLAGFQIDGDQRLGVEVVARPVAAVGVDRRRLARAGRRARLRDRR